MDEYLIEYHRMTIEGLDHQRFLVAKLRRFSSPPVLEGPVPDLQASALERLVDIIRCGPESRNYKDLVAIEPILEKEWGVTAAGEWEAYHRSICQVKHLERLELVTLTTPRWLQQEPNPDLRVAYHEASMNERPYLLARVGKVIGSPSAILLTFPHHRESAFFRLFDVFRISQQGQVYRDFVEVGRRLGKADEDIPAASWRGAAIRLKRDGREKEVPRRRIPEGLCSLGTPSAGRASIGRRRPPST